MPKKFSKCKILVGKILTIQHPFVKIHQTFPPSQFYTMRYHTLAEMTRLLLEVFTRHWNYSTITNVIKICEFMGSLSCEYIMVRRLFQNYYMQSVDPKNKNRLNFCVSAQKLTRFLIHKNRPNFYCTKINPIFITQKSTRFLLHKNQGGVYFTDRIEILWTNTFSD